MDEQFAVFHCCQQPISQKWYTTTSVCQKVWIFHFSIHILVLQVMAPCSLAGAYLYLRKTFCLSPQGRVVSDTHKTKIQTFNIMTTTNFLLLTLLPIYRIIPAPVFNWGQFTVIYPIIPCVFLATIIMNRRSLKRIEKYARTEYQHIFHINHL